MWQTTMVDALRGVTVGCFEVPAFALLLVDAPVDAGRNQAEQDESVETFPVSVEDGLIAHHV